MAGRLRRRSGHTELETDEGPFVSFTDLFIGILFLFLILVAALMLMHQEAVQEAELEQRRLMEQIRILQAKLDESIKLDADHVPFRLAIVYNSFQKAANEKTWTFSRTVQIYRAPNGLCLSNIILRNNLNVSWKPPVKADAIPTAANQDFVRAGAPCTLSAAGERWNSDSETGGVQRAGPNLYSGSTALHKNGGDEKIDMQYRVLGIYDDYFRNGAAQPAPKAAPSKRT
jgi:hypothetical protein